MGFPIGDVLEFRDCGRVPYRDAFAMQQTAHAEVLAARESPTPRPMPVLLVEHDPPVITISRRPGAEANLVAGPERLAAEGVIVETTDRGGDVTYHGPGQLVVYPIIDLNRIGLRIHGYMRMLEQVVIDTIAEFGVRGHRDGCATGVWIGGEGDDPACGNVGTGGRKVCAMGVRVSRWVAMHGLALNVTTNLDHFKLIVPCGLPGRSVTSLAAELQSAVPAMQVVRWALAEHLLGNVMAALAAAPSSSER